MNKSLFKDYFFHCYWVPNQWNTHFESYICSFQIIYNLYFLSFNFLQLVHFYIQMIGAYGVL